MESDVSPLHRVTNASPMHQGRYFLKCKYVSRGGLVMLSQIGFAPTTTNRQGKKTTNRPSNATHAKCPLTKATQLIQFDQLIVGVVCIAKLSLAPFEVCEINLVNYF